MFKRLEALLIPGAGFLLAFFFLRLELLSALGVGLPGSILDFKAQLLAGAIGDLAVLLLLFSVSAVGAAFLRIPLAWSFAPLATLAWLTSAASALYFRFFSSRLDLWVARSHFSDIGQVRGSAFHLLGGNPWIPVAALIGTASFFALLFGCSPTLGLSRRTRLALSAPFCVGLALLLKQSPVWVHIHAWDPSQGGFRGSVLSEQVIFNWWEQSFADSRTANESENLMPQAEVNQFFAKYRALAAGPTNVRKPTSGRNLRAELGLPETGPIHVFIVFMESARALELYDPWLGPQVAPRLSTLLARQGIVFEQAYSSSSEGGQTSRGLFSTLCGSFTHFGGPSVFIGYNHLKARCLPEALGEAGYATLSIQPFRKNYHNSYTFERSHGTQQFYDMEDVKAWDPSTRIGSWGAAEDKYLEFALQTLREKAKEGKPLFAHLRTNSTHHPPEENPRGALPEAVSARTGRSQYYHYLSNLSFSDQTVSRFIDGVFASELGPRTLIVLLADHSLPHDIGSIRELTDYQHREARFRIPLALLTQRLPKPLRVSDPVHQMDVAPTLARITGVPVSPLWPCAGLLSGKACPGIFKSDQGVAYRLGQQSCYPRLRGNHATTCFTIKEGVDPLFSATAQETTELPPGTAYFEALIRANHAAIVRNSLHEAWVASP